MIVSHQGPSGHKVLQLFQMLKQRSQVLHHMIRQLGQVVQLIADAIHCFGAQALRCGAPASDLPDPRLLGLLQPHDAGDILHSLVVIVRRHSLRAEFHQGKVQLPTDVAQLTVSGATAEVAADARFQRVRRGARAIAPERLGDVVLEGGFIACIQPLDHGTIDSEVSEYGLFAARNVRSQRQ